MSELKPCPCCGAENSFRTVHPEIGIPSGDSGYRMTIKCRDRECGCIITRWALKKAWAVESAETAWNHRAQPANDPLTLEQLRDMESMAVWAESDNADDPRCGAYIVDDRPEFCSKPLVNCHHAISADEIKSGAYRIYCRKPEACIGIDLVSGHDSTVYCRKPETANGK